MTAVKSPSVETPRASRAECHVSEQPSIRVLVVDDDPDIYELLCAVADSHPIVEVVAHAPTPEAALAISRADPPDVILLDHQFPSAGQRRPQDPVMPILGRGITGLEAIAYLKAAAPGAVIAVYTGMSQLAASVKNAGADLYLVKGHDPQLVLDEVAERVLSRAAVDPA
jgi:CheY-like chemotaxis protein